MNAPEFTETYSRNERVRVVLLDAVLGAAALATWKWWALPWITDFADSAPCRSVFGADATTVLWLGLFVGLPALIAALLGLTLGRSGVAILRHGQYPPRGAKGFRPIRIRRGATARWIGYLHLLACVPFIAIAVRGYGQAGALSHLAGPAQCAGQPHGNVAAVDRHG